jgi:hypothetical protein
LKERGGKKMLTWLMVAVLGIYTIGLCAATLLIGELFAEARAAGEGPPNWKAKGILIAGALAWPLAGFVVMVWIAAVVMTELLSPGRGEFLESRALSREEEGKNEPNRNAS